MGDPVQLLLPTRVVEDVPIDPEVEKELVMRMASLLLAALKVDAGEEENNDVRL